MGRIADVIRFSRSTTEDGVEVAEVECDLGGDTVTAICYLAAGSSEHPMPGDKVALISTGSSGGWAAVGFSDPALTFETLPGEHVIFSRSAPGVVASKIHLKADGSIVFNDGAAVLGADGVLTVPNDVSGGGKSLKTHTHGPGTYAVTAAPGSVTPGTSSGPPT